MRLLLASFIRDNRHSGMGKWTHRVADALRARGHAVECWWAHDFPATERAGRWAVLGFPPALAARVVARRADFDAVVLHEPSALAYALCRRASPGLPPLVAMCHNVESKVHGVLLGAAAAGLADIPLGRRVKPRLVRNWQSDAALRLADAVGCLSREDAAYLVRLGVAPGRVVAMANGVDAGTFNRAARAAVGSRVLFIGGWLEVKGRRVVAAAWPQVCALHPGARLTLLGTGAGESEVLADFPPGCRASVRVLPRVEEEGAVARELAAHDLFLMPSVSEGSPLALLEAMASGLPAVATRVGGIPDVLDDGVEGLTVPPLDVPGLVRALDRLLSDPARAEALGQAARRRSEGLTWEATARALEEACVRAQGRQAS